MAQLGVIWFANRIKHGGLVTKKQFLDLLDEAIEMDKQAIIDAYNQGSEAGYELAKNDDIHEGYKTKEGIDYYNEIFKSE